MLLSAIYNFMTNISNNLLTMEIKMTKFVLRPYWDKQTIGVPISIKVIKQFKYTINEFTQKVIIFCIVNQKYGFDKGYAVIETSIQEGHPKYTDYIQDELFLFEKYDNALNFFLKFDK